jgi:hypothetical protein
LANQANESLRDFLFLQHTSHGGINVVPVGTAEKRFKSFLLQHEQLRGFSFTLDMIRPSVLLQIAHENDGNLLAAQFNASHASFSTTSGYTDKYPTRVIYERQIREFQQLFQVVAIADIASAPRKLGISTGQFRALFGEANRTGLGVACLNPKAGFQPGTVQGQDCDKLELCSGCSLRFVVATVPNVTDLILFNYRLEVSRPEMEATRPERWAEVWLPWLIFSEVALDKMSRGPEAAIYLEAKAAADVRIAAGDLHLPPPW